MGRFTHKQLLLTALALAIIAFNSTTSYADKPSASTLMPIKVSIISCISQEERIRMCESDSMCCNLIDGLVETHDAYLDNINKEITNTASDRQKKYQPKRIRLTLKNPEDYR